MKRCPFYRATLALIKEEVPRLLEEWCEFKHSEWQRPVAKRVQCGGDDASCPLLNDPTLQLPQ